MKSVIRWSCVIAYHLYLRPGSKLLRKRADCTGSWHGTNLSWRTAAVTRFSVLSHPEYNRGWCLFRSHIDGSEHRISPEYVISLQENWGRILWWYWMSALKVQPGKRTWQGRLLQTAEWARRCFRAHNDTGQYLFGIIQRRDGFPMRTLSATEITAIWFSRLCYWRFKSGEPKATMWNIVDHDNSLMPREKPRYLMGCRGARWHCWRCSQGQ